MDYTKCMGYHPAIAVKTAGQNLLVSAGLTRLSGDGAQGSSVFRTFYRSASVSNPIAIKLETASKEWKAPRLLIAEDAEESWSRACDPCAFDVSKPATAREVGFCTVWPGTLHNVS